MMKTFAEYCHLRNEQEYELLKSQVLKEYGQAAQAPAPAMGQQGAQQGGQIYGNVAGLNDQQIDAGLDAIKLGLDAWGFEQFTGWIGDLISGGISGAQAGWKMFRGDKAGAADHALDAGVSLVSAIPLGDIAKLIKLRHGPKYAKMFIKAGKTARLTGNAHKQAKKGQRAANVTGTFGQGAVHGAQQAGLGARQYTNPVPSKVAVAAMRAGMSSQ
jgi:hypothetical protein